VRLPARLAASAGLRHRPWNGHRNTARVNATDRNRIRAAVDQARRREIFRGPIDHRIRRIADCEHCGALIPHTRRFCDQACINGYRKEHA
jgi:hypothetical protein